MRNLLDSSFEIGKTKLPILDQLCRDLFKGGKGVRSRLVQNISEELGLDKENTSILCECVESIHYSSILHDDVIDASLFRRNRIAAWVKFSKAEAVLGGDYLIAHVLCQFSNINNMALIQLTSQTLRSMVQGELLQREILGRETLENLNQVHIFKTSSLFEWGVRAPFLLLNLNQPELQTILTKIGRILGQLFQRSDDALDFGIRNKEKKKEFQDLKGGYLNFFGTYLKEKKMITCEKKLRACRNVRQLNKVLRAQNLDQCVQLFDKMNQQLVDECQTHIQALKDYLEPDQQKVIPRLTSWINSLYFR